jgi:nucleoside-diphosphate-sugar epimerase
LPSPALITGGAGFIGSRLALRLRKQGVVVRVLARPDHDAGALEDAGVHVTRGDASERDSVAAAADGSRVIYHLAAARGRHKLAYRDFQRQNRRLSEAVGEGALSAGVDRLVVSSTATLAGQSGPEPQTEATPPRPNSAYRASRWRAERVLEGFGDRGLEVVIARVPQRVMGPGTRDWTRVARAVRDGAYRILPGGGTIHSGDVDDVVDGLCLCGSRPGIGGERFLLGGPAPSRITDVLGVLADRLGVPFEPIIVPSAPVRAYVALGNAVFRSTRLSLPHHFTAEFFSARVALDLGKARRELGYTPRFGMPESMTRTVSSLCERGLL